MAQKHKSKYKTPKDFEKSQKPKPRKDLKDYTEDDKKGALNPRSTGDKQLNVLRKTDKAVQDDGKMFPKYNDDDRLYKDIEEGDYDPKTAAKRLKKRQDTEEKEVKDVLKDKIENLTREQKERLVREYVRRKIQKVLFEQKATAPEEEPAAPETPPADAAAPAPETPPADAATPSPETPPADAPPADMGSMPTGGGAPAPSAPAPTDAATPTPDATATPPADASATPPADASAPAPAAPSPEEETDKLIQKASERLSKEGAIGKIKLINKILKNAMQEVDIEDKGNFYKMLRSFAIKKISTLSTESDPQETEEQKPQS